MRRGDVLAALPESEVRIAHVVADDEDDVRLRAGSAATRGHAETTTPRIAVFQRASQPRSNPTRIASRIEPARRPYFPTSA